MRVASGTVSVDRGRTKVARRVKRGKMIRILRGPG
jgi:ribosomal 50S subunit-recycling heat shock protein